MRHSLRKPSGHVEISGPFGELRRGDTLKCTHCQFSWIVSSGSGKVRGFCSNCAGYTCGKPECGPCVHFERRLENLEAGRPELTPMSSSILVPGLPCG